MSSRRAKTAVTSGSMRKRMITPISKCTKKHKSNNYMKDWISRLPDEILVSILSLLGIREAARTCVLSKRWEHVWSYKRVLNFDALQTILHLKSNRNELEVGRSRYINWVNKVVESHHGSTIDEFRVSFCLNNSSSCDIDRWIEFAITKRVQRLEVDFEPWCFHRDGVAYAFTNRIYIHIKTPAGFSSIRSLRSLCFKFVNISGEILECFVSNCPLLESLHVESSRDLVNLKVVGSSLRLKVLEISFCRHLMDLEVCAPSLVSFKYFGQGSIINMQIKDAFQLAEVSTSDFSRQIDYAFFPFSSYFSQLENLSLGMQMTQGNRGFKQLPEFTKLKHLTLHVDADESSSFIGWTNLINASPLLHKFKLQLQYSRHWGKEKIKMHESKRRKVGNCPHGCLKEVELAGFVGRLLDLELAKYLIKNAIKLEKITIDRHWEYSSSARAPRVFKETKKKLYAKELAMQLQESLPARVKMEII
ncbi:F-box/LRR-repeat protein At2g42730-like [Cornus florida]|uniref:F-box/LRR-repeat protein At2g42730-like n=1 Tax=Cornus florida TaxID=4283 RepID=UPI00289EF73C|nr:F-box/LRR-repeat protein At2g42730-like [Cornus florida]